MTATAVSFPRAARFAPGALPLLAAGIFGLACLLLVRGLDGFPLNADHSYFLPVSFYFDATGKLDNPWLNPIDSHVFNWHGFVQPWLVAKLSPDGSWSGVTFGLDLLAGLCFAAVILAAVRLGLGTVSVLALSSMALALLLDMRSRPEVLATLLTVALLCLFAMRHGPLFAGRIRAAAGGVLFGTLLCTHPAIFGLSAIAFAAFALATTGRERPRLADVAAFAGIMAAIFAATVLGEVHFIHGGTFAEWFDGIVRHATRTALRQDIASLTPYFVANRFLPGIALGFVFAVPPAARFWHTPAPAGLPLRLWQGLQALVLAALVLAVYRVAVRVPATYYNFSGLMVALALAGCLAARGSAILEKTMLAGLALLGLAGMAGTLLWLGQNAYDGPMIRATARALEADVLGELAAGRRVCADAAVLTAMSNIGDAVQLRISVPASEEELQPSRALCDTYVRLQPQLHALSPGAIPQFKLAADHFIAHPAAIGWMRPLYLGYAIYR